MGKAGKGILAAAILAGVGAIFTAGFSIGAVSFFSLSGIQAVFAHAVVGGVLSGLSSSLTSKPKKAASGSLAYDSSSRNQQIRQPISSHQVVYGEVRKSGTVVYGTSTNDKKFLHFVIALGGHEFTSIDEVWLDDEVIPNDWLDADGMVIQGRYANKVRIRKHLGEDGQTADAALVAEVTEWTSAHRGRGRPYIYVRYELDRTLFPNGAPNLSAVCRGAKVYDPRIDMKRWTPNIALFADDYLRSTQYGFGIEDTDIGLTENSASANACEEMVEAKQLDCEITEMDVSTNTFRVAGSILQFHRGTRVEARTTDTLPAGLEEDTDYYIIPYQFKGAPRVRLAASLDDAINNVAVDITDSGIGTMTLRRTGEPRYFGGGVLDTNRTLGDNLKDILSGMAGKAAETGGLWKLFAGVWRAPSAVLDESHLIAPLQYTTRRSRQSRFNTVKGIYVSHVNNWQPSDYPVITNSAHLSADQNETLIHELDLPFTQSVSTAQRIATIALNAHRQEITGQYPVNLTGIQFQPCSTIAINNRRAGWEEKHFEVGAWKFTVNERDEGQEPVIGISMTIEETAAGVYSWASEAELLIDPAPNSTLPNAFDVSPPTGLSIDSKQVESQGGDSSALAIVKWTPHPDYFVRYGGQLQFEYKEASQPSTAYLATKPVWGDALQADLFTGSPGTVYDIRARAVNSKGIPSVWNYALSGFTLGTSGGITDFIDYGLVTDTPTSDEDFGSVTDVPSSDDDYGSTTG